MTILVAWVCGALESAPEVMHQVVDICRKFGELYLHTLLWYYMLIYYEGAPAFGERAEIGVND